MHGVDFLNADGVSEILNARFCDEKIKSLSQIPHPETLTDAQTAAQIIHAAMQKNEQILVVGDYDADGVTATCIFMEFFRAVGYERATYRIPNRFSHGYGISVPFLEKILQARSFSLIITVDNGIAALDVGEFCAQNGIKFLITDHHLPQKSLPKSVAIVNPKRVDCGFLARLGSVEICGAMVAFYVVSALKILKNSNFALKNLFFYVACGSIADVMPLRSINRVFVRRALEIFSKSDTIQHQILKTWLKKSEILAEDIAFYVAPLINSCGRVSDANLVVDFFLEKTAHRARQIFADMVAQNDKRKNLTAKIINSIEQNDAQILENDHVIVACGAFHEGVLGIAAGALARTRKKNAFVLSEKNGLLKGSGRHDGRSDIFSPLLANASIFSHFGGHAAAVGFTMKGDFLQDFFQIFSKAPPIFYDENKNSALGTVKISAINENFLRAIEAFEPFGAGNPAPVFLMRGKILQKKIIKEEHVKFLLTDPENGAKIETMAFFCKDFARGVEKNDEIFAKIYVKRDWRGAPTVIVSEFLDAICKKNF